ncbi:LytR/AlgR family response regulator transcription factor [Cyclobacterium qasimii]|uniref:Response regulator of the LytR/AlgR family n=2 Tax=Cyclobacterium qasimii TaxID=1350429 RepID=S7WJA0_9BACT|nr:LytTR family transcriptional regulator DNA-binding domain-containing protein [Cyclobacterium qasimii]EPR66784.1 Response regulator of the LytR/AlgR family [Cyclobacterium qasimii M12-11B]GEO21674.1 DNA-binding response regulator [Cyclobacterium qasimii]
MIRCLIIDDEPLAQDLLQDYLNDFPDIEVLGKFNDGFEAFKGIGELKPDLIFLDIEMPKITGFELLELLENPPKVIFTTAYDTYAIKAFELQAIDYLLKPFSKDRLAQAIQRVSIDEDNGSVTQSKMSKVREDIPKEGFLKRVVVKTGNKIEVLNASNIASFSADGDYVKINSDGKSYLKLGTMAYYEKMLDPQAFIRIHRSHLVNISTISKIEPYQKENYLIFLKDGAQLPVSKKGMVKLKKALRI